MKITKMLFYRLCRIQLGTRMHSSRMRTGRSLTVCCSLLPGGVLLGPGGFSLVQGGLPGPGGGLPVPGGFFLVLGGFSLVWGVLPARGGVLPGPGGGWVCLVPGEVGGFSRDPPCEQNHRHV